MINKRANTFVIQMTIFGSDYLQTSVGSYRAPRFQNIAS